jgi:endo-1,4-beta-xylanase
MPGRAAVRAGASPSLSAAANACGLRYGSDSDTDIAEAPAEYRGLLVHQCDLFAPILSWRSVARSAAAAEPQWEDPNVGFARENGLMLTGAHLLWHESTPGWFAAIRGANEARDRVERHIATMAATYAGRTYSWNVVNEALDPRHGRADGLRESAYLRRLGPDFLAHAFKAARAADPNALLTYNDFGLEMDRRDHAAKRVALLGLLDRLQRAGAPIDAVGVQSHLHLDGSRFDAGLFRAFLREIASRGLTILITELDVLDLLPAGDAAARDAEVAALYRAYLDATLDEPAVGAVVTWGLSDRYTWLVADTDPRFQRADKQPARPLPFDDSFQPKPAFDAILAAFRGAPPRLAGVRAHNARHSPRQVAGVADFPSHLVTDK